MLSSPIRSLQGRLLLLSLVFLPVLLGVAGLALEQSHSRSLLASQAERLKIQVYLVLGAMDFRNGELNLPASLAEPRYGQLESGLYALLTAPAGQVLWRSPSSVSLDWRPAQVDEPALAPGQSRSGPVRMGAHDLYEYQLAVIWEHLGGEETPFVIRILEDMTPLKAEIRSYRIYVWLAMGAIALAWLLMLVVLVHWGLRPLHQLTEDLRDIEQGTRDQLEGQYPTEVQRLTQRLNQLIHAERQQRERYRNTLADLAHSLKTPLAVIRGTVQGMDTENSAEPEHGNTTRTEIEAQVERMDQIVAYQLQRAVMAADQRLLKPIAVAPLVKRLLATLEKVYRDKGIQAEFCGDESLRLLGDERDFLEVLGNILDNAFKYGRTQVRVGLSRELRSGYTLLRIEDDGPGMAAETWQQVQKRGVRADQIQPGQGIGLAVAGDILRTYQGRLGFCRSAWGGACIELRFPSR
jgi:two-component system, OmpR family, sensor histidine kinase PhoQ